MWSDTTGCKTDDRIQKEHELIENPEWKSGLQMEEKVRAELFRLFEPHIVFLKSKYGYKKENIYYFYGV